MNHTTGMVLPTQLGATLECRVVAGRRGVLGHECRPRRPERIAQKMPESRRSSRLRATDWVDAALVLLTAEDGGEHGVTISRLCRTLGVTKGSFYWHFRDLDALWEAMAVRWQKENRRRITDVDEESILHRLHSGSAQTRAGRSGDARRCASGSTTSRGIR